MTRYWTPTRASYLDYVSKARIAEVVSEAVSSKAAAELGKMKKADAAAAAELRLAKVAWVPEILSDRETPATPSWESCDGANDEDENDQHEASEGNDGVDSADGTDAKDDDIGDGHDTGNGTKQVNDTPPDAAAAPASASQQPSWPYPTADSMSTGQSGPLAA